MTNKPIKLRIWDAQASKYLEDTVMWSVAKMPDEMMPGQPPFVPFLMVALHSPADKYVVEQSTGLTDKNGQEIYEGDIVKTIQYDGWFDKVGFPVNYRVEWSTIKTGWRGFRGSMTDKDAGVPIVPSQDVEVIGHIHQNPDLLS
jgi:uncharacterized phage protein (TIGR01671 family)